MTEIKKNKSETFTFNHGFNYLMAKIAQASKELSQPINIKDQEAVDRRDEMAKKFARLQKLRDQKNNK